MNKFLVTIIVPAVEMDFDVYLPNNKKIGTIKKYLLETIADLTGQSFLKDTTQIKLTNRETGIEYDNNSYVKDTDIKNGVKIILI